MKTIQNLGKVLSKDELKKIAGGAGNQYCFTLQGSFGICKTDYLCDLDLPICEAV